ncbi:hypothetical protein CKAH01_17175 [Colletotrichum kahawae]|uniref:Uncharacterized protein n=1 Tax=Colletotrichum kahawae TaxID=34407 RepID=A0AAD9YBK5_COLKA|nr:hypothetical protein CKAH01_17175 [Colletotrichum kahawae]
MYPDGPYGQDIHLENFKTVTLVAEGCGIFGTFPHAMFLAQRAFHNRDERKKMKDQKDFSRSAERLYGDMTRKVNLFWVLELQAQDRLATTELSQLMSLDDGHPINGAEDTLRIPDHVKWMRSHGTKEHQYKLLREILVLDSYGCDSSAILNIERLGGKGFKNKLPDDALCVVCTPEAAETNKTAQDATTKGIRVVGLQWLDDGGSPANLDQYLISRNEDKAEDRRESLSHSTPPQQTADASKPEIPETRSRMDRYEGNAESAESTPTKPSTWKERINSTLKFVAGTPQKKSSAAVTVEEAKVSFKNPTFNGKETSENANGPDATDADTGPKAISAGRLENPSSPTKTPSSARRSAAGQSGESQFVDSIEGPTHASSQRPDGSREGSNPNNPITASSASPEMQTDGRREGSTESNPIPVTSASPETHIDGWREGSTESNLITASSVSPETHIDGWREGSTESNPIPASSASPETHIDGWREGSTESNLTTASSASPETQIDGRREGSTESNPIPVSSASPETHTDGWREGSTESNPIPVTSASPETHTDGWREGSTESNPIPVTSASPETHTDGWREGSTESNPIHVASESPEPPKTSQASPILKQESRGGNGQQPSEIAALRRKGIRQFLPGDAKDFTGIKGRNRWNDAQQQNAFNVVFFAEAHGEKNNGDCLVVYDGEKAMSKTDIIKAGGTKWGRIIESHRRPEISAAPGKMLWLEESVTKAAASTAIPPATRLASSPPAAMLPTPKSVGQPRFAQYVPHTPQAVPRPGGGVPLQRSSTERTQRAAFPPVSSLSSVPAAPQPSATPTAPMGFPPAVVPPAVVPPTRPPPTNMAQGFQQPMYRQFPGPQNWVQPPMGWPTQEFVSYQQQAAPFYVLPASQSPYSTRDVSMDPSGSFRGSSQPPLAIQTATEPPNLKSRGRVLLQQGMNGAWYLGTYKVSFPDGRIPAPAGQVDWVTDGLNDYARTMDGRLWRVALEVNP